MDIAYANARRVSECLDLAAWMEGSPHSEVTLQVDTGNRCDHAVEVELARLRVTATCGGSALPLSPNDPEDAPPPRRLAPHRLRSATLVYLAPRCTSSRRVCIDVSAVSTNGITQAPICFPTPSPDA
jgi:hypothetical protein